MTSAFNIALPAPVSRPLSKSMMDETGAWITRWFALARDGKGGWIEIEVAPPAERPRNRTEKDSDHGRG